MRRLTLPLSVLIWLGIWVGLRFGVQPPIPGSVLGLYMSIATVAITVYLVADQARFQAFLDPLVALLRERRLAVPRILLGVALPLLLGWVTYNGVRPRVDPPFDHSRVWRGMARPIGLCSSPRRQGNPRRRSRSRIISQAPGLTTRS